MLMVIFGAGASYDALADAQSALGGADRLSSLPASASSFVGRDHELTELRALLASTRLLALVGTGGAGKTTLIDNSKQSANLNKQ